MDMNIRLIDESCKKHLYTAIKKSIKDGSYLADPMLKEQLYADIVVTRNMSRCDKGSMEEIKHGNDHCCFESKGWLW